MNETGNTGRVRDERPSPFGAWPDPSDVRRPEVKVFTEPDLCKRIKALTFRKNPFPRGKAPHQQAPIDRADFRRTSERVGFSFAPTRLFEMASESEEKEFIGAWMRPELYRRVKAGARRQDRTVSSFLRQALRRRLDAEDRIRERSRRHVEQ